jgi:hypothetical protein
MSNISQRSMYNHRNSRLVAKFGVKMRKLGNSARINLE